MIEKLPYEEIINKYRSASELNKKYVKEIERLKEENNNLKFTPKTRFKDVIELREENKRLNNLNEQLVEECQKQENIITNLQERIDKAKEYIENNLWSDYGDRCEVSKKEIFQILEGDKE